VTREQTNKQNGDVYRALQIFQMVRVPKSKLNWIEALAEIGKRLRGDILIPNRIQSNVFRHDVKLLSQGTIYKGYWGEESGTVTNSGGLGQRPNLRRLKKTEPMFWM